MAIIECINGPTTQSVGGSEYTFVKDDHDRFTAKVTELVHLRMFLSRPAVYREVPETPLPKKSRKAVQPGKQEEPENSGNGETQNEGNTDGTGNSEENGNDGAGNDGSGTDEANNGAA
ncbi:hypothetical protein OIV19_21570 [Brucella sp. HL-2]|nr:hypothetical protein [Brucella sp. HL-2]MCV9910188.1 hypothetical protein [Brucella sp. HL-2]